MTDFGELAQRLLCFLDPADQQQFREACADTAVSTEVTVKSWLTVWKTTLMGDSLARLRALAADQELANLVKVVSIADNTEQFDPWLHSSTPSETKSCNIWPRGEHRIVTSTKIGVTALQAILLDAQLRPNTILVRDHRIAATNLAVQSRTLSHVEGLVAAEHNASDCDPAVALAADIIRGSNMALTSVDVATIDVALAESSLIHSVQFQRQSYHMALASPNVTEVCIGLSPSHQGQDKGFALLRTAKLRLGQESCTYWLEKVLYCAIALVDLEISIHCQWTMPMNTRKVVPKLHSFTLSRTSISAEAICHFLSASGQSLIELNFYQVALVPGSTWLDLLSDLATRSSNLGSFSLKILREEMAGHMAIDYSSFDREHLEEQCRGGLQLVAKGPAHSRRVTRVSYAGPNANRVLGIVARYGRTVLSSNP